MKKNKISAKDFELLLRPLNDEQLDSLSKSDLKELLKFQFQVQQAYKEVVEESQQQKKINEFLQEKILIINGKLTRIVCRIFRPKSEKNPNLESKNKRTPSEAPIKRCRNLGEKYPHAMIVEQVVSLDKLPNCSSCQQELSESGMYEESEVLKVIPAQFIITKILRTKYRCKHCHSCLLTAPQVPRIIPRSNLSDELIIDSTLSKYCDYIPMERYCEIAARKGFDGLPPHSLIGASITFAYFLTNIYELIRTEVLDSLVMLADETPHPMLEGDAKKNWFMWVFSSLNACFYECHDTRSSEVAIDVLSESSCEYLVTDAYAGYSKSISEVNKFRSQANRDPVVAVQCNVHARRGFFEAKDDAIEAEYFLTEYQEIYKKEKEVKELIKNPELALLKRREMEIHFINMKNKATDCMNNHSSHSLIYKACQYYLNQYVGLTICLTKTQVPLDNNQSERSIKSTVMGRKVWFGTHSPRGSFAAATHFTIIESCKLIKLNPREYYEFIVQRIHLQKELMTPSRYKSQIQQSNLSPD